jgi:hypothetical protein
MTDAELDGVREAGSPAISFDYLLLWGTTGW